MIATATTGTGFKGAISYIQKEHEKNLSEGETPELISKNNLYGDTKKMSSQMRFLANENSRVSRPVLHVAVSFHKSEKLTPEQAEKAVHSVLKEIGVEKENNQFLLIKHNDAKHEHYHAVINKVGFDGKNIDTSYIKNRLQVACDKIEQEQGLRRTEGRTILYDPTNEKGYRFLNKEEKAAVMEKKRAAPIRDKSTKIADEKNHIQSKISEALKNKEVNTSDKFKNILEKEGIQVKYMENRNGISGVSFKYENQAYKGTSLNYRWKQIENKLEQNKKITQNKDRMEGDDRRMLYNLPLKLDKYTEEEKKEIMFTRDYNKAIDNVIIKHKEEYNKENVKPDTDKIFKENGFRKENDVYVFEKDGHRQEVSSKSFELSNENAKRELETHKKKLEEYNKLMNTQPKKEPALFGKEKVREENKKLEASKKEAVKPIFKPETRLDYKTYSIHSSAMLNKIKEQDQAKFKDAVQRNKDAKEKGVQGTKAEEKKNKNKGLGM